MRRYLLLLAGAAGLVLALHAAATVVLRYSTLELTNLSQAIVRATVASQEYRWNDDHNQIYTYTKLEVQEWLKDAGERPPYVTVRQFGGIADGLIQKVAGDGQFTPGEEVFVFLRRQDGLYFLTALAQAKYKVITHPTLGKLAERDLRELGFASIKPGQQLQIQPSLSIVRPLKLDDLIIEVRRYLVPLQPADPPLEKR